MSKDKSRTTTSLKTETKQPTFICDSSSFLLWRRVFLIRYFQNLGSYENADVDWTDYDPKYNIIKLRDEEKPFEPKLPSKDLFKSVTEIFVNKKKMLIVNLFYTTNKCHIQGLQAKAWAKQEYEVLNKLVGELKRIKGNYSKIDDEISNIQFPDMFEIQKQSEDTSQAIPADVNTGETINVKKTLQTETLSTSSEDVLIEDQTNCSCQKDIQQLQASLHKIEQILVEKSNAETLILKKSEHILTQLDKICSRLDQKNMGTDRDVVEELQKVVKTEVYKISSEIEDKHSEAVSISEENVKRVSKEIKENFEMANLDMEKEFIKFSSQFEDDSSKVLKAIEENTHKVISAIKEDIDSDSESSDDEDYAPQAGRVGKTPSPVTDKKNQNSEKIQSTDTNNSNETTNTHFKQYEEDVWIIGTSIVKDLIAKRLYRNKKIRVTTLKEKTIRGAKALIKTGKVSAANILFQVGSNDLDFEDDVESVVREMTELITLCKTSVPGCKILIGQVLPRYYRNHTERQKFERKRMKYNECLTELKTDLDVIIIEHNNLTQVDFEDGIHLSRDSGVPVFVRNIKDKLNPILGVTYEFQPRQGNTYGYQNRRHNQSGSQENYTHMYESNRDNYRRGQRNNQFDQNARSQERYRHSYNPRYDSNNYMYDRPYDMDTNDRPHFQDRSYHIPLREGNYTMRSRNHDDRYQNYVNGMPQEYGDRYQEPQDSYNQSVKDTNSLLCQLLTKLKN